MSIILIQSCQTAGIELRLYYVLLYQTVLILILTVIIHMINLSAREIYAHYGTSDIYCCELKLKFNSEF